MGALKGSIVYEESVGTGRKRVVTKRLVHYFGGAKPKPVTAKLIKPRQPSKGERASVLLRRIESAARPGPFSRQAQEILRYDLETYAWWTSANKATKLCDGLILLLNREDLMAELKASIWDFVFRLDELSKRKPPTKSEVTCTPNVIDAEFE